MIDFHCHQRVQPKKILISSPSSGARYELVRIITSSVIQCYRIEDARLGTASKAKESYLIFKVYHVFVLFMILFQTTFSFKYKKVLY